MPQMSPLSWVTLMLLFLTIYLMNTIKMYFNNLLTSPSNMKNTASSLNQYNWKW